MSILITNYSKHFLILNLVSGKPTLTNVRSSCINGDLTFTWDVSTNETSPRNFILYNNSWINLNDTRHIVKDAFLYKSIAFTIDVPESDSWTYTGNILYSLNESLH